MHPNPDERALKYSAETQSAVSRANANIVDKRATADRFGDRQDRAALEARVRDRERQYLRDIVSAVILSKF